MSYTVIEITREVKQGLTTGAQKGEIRIKSLVDIKQSALQAKVRAVSEGEFFLTWFIGPVLTNILNFPVLVRMSI